MPAPSAGAAEASGFTCGILRGFRLRKLPTNPTVQNTVKLSHGEQGKVYKCKIAKPAILATLPQV